MSGTENQGAEGLVIHDSDGARVRSLKESLNQGVEKLVGGWKASLYAKCFPSLIPENEEVLQALRASLADTVRSAIYKDLEVLVEEHAVKQLGELGTIVKNYSGPKDVKAWRPTGDPVVDMRAHDAKVLQHERQRSLESLAQQQQQSEKLLQKVKAGREQCHANSLEIQKRASVLSEVTKACDNIPKDYMIAFTEEACSNAEVSNARGLYMFSENDD